MLLVAAGGEVERKLGVRFLTRRAVVDWMESRLPVVVVELFLEGRWSSRVPLGRVWPGSADTAGHAI